MTSSYHIKLGRWAESGLFRAFIDELLSIHLNPIIGSYSVNNVGRVRIFSHSGGYYTIGNMAIVGGVDATKDICLLDSLYADFDQFDQFVQENLMSFGSSDLDYRFSSVYSSTGGTYQNNQAMAKRSYQWVVDANRTEIYLLDNSANDLTNKIIKEKSLLYKFTNLTHDDIPRNLFYTFLVGAP
jgi:hypothetical protein